MEGSGQSFGHGGGRAGMVPEDQPVTSPASATTSQPASPRGPALTDIVALVRALAWPLLVLFLLVLYHGPFSRTMEEIPTLIAHATEMKVGSVSVTIDQKLDSLGNERLASALKGLSPEARRVLLETGNTPQLLWSPPSSIDGKPIYHRRKLEGAINELADRKLITFIDSNYRGHLDISYTGASAPKDPKAMGLEPAPPSPFDDPMGTTDQFVTLDGKPLSRELENDMSYQGFMLTPLGKKAFQVIVDVVTHS